MSAESHELLWETNLSDQPSLTDKTETFEELSSTTITCTSSSPATVSPAERSSSPLACKEESLLLDDWDETQEQPDPEPLPAEVIALMDARMAAPQGGLDVSSASHSCEHPAVSLKRKRIFSYEWVQREEGQPPVGMILLYMKLRQLL